jgi:hypothetical protein
MLGQADVGSVTDVDEKRNRYAELPGAPFTASFT